MSLALAQEFDYVDLDDEEEELCSEDDSEDEQEEHRCSYCMDCLGLSWRDFL